MHTDIKHRHPEVRNTCGVTASFPILLAMQLWSSFPHCVQVRSINDVIMTYAPSSFSDSVQVRSVSFPPRRFFGNRIESFVMLRKDMLQVSRFVECERERAFSASLLGLLSECFVLLFIQNYLREMLNLCSTLRSCHLNVPEGQTLTKWDLSFFHNFFKQGIFEQTRAYNAS